MGAVKGRSRWFAQAAMPAMVLLFTFLVTSALLSGPENDGPRGPRTETVYPVTAVDVTLGDNRAVLRAFGEIVAAETAELRIASPGEVVEVHPELQVGHTVEAGTELLTIDPFAYEGELRDARAQLAEARARKAEAEARISMESAMLSRADEQLGLAEVDLSRAERLVASGTITDRALDDRRLLVSQRQQARDQRRFTLEAEQARRAQQAAAIERLTWQVERAERALADTVLAAPFTGIVRAENVARGRILAANDMAVSLIRADALDARFVLSDQRYGRLISRSSLFGTEVEVIWRIGDTPLTYAATVTRAGADIEGGRAGVDVFARLAVGDAPLPRPGAFVEVRVPGVIHSGTARIPLASLYGNEVFVIGEDDRLSPRVVTVLAIDDEEAIVRGALAEGDEVVSSRLAEAGEGIKVQRVDPFAAPTAPAEDPATADQTVDQTAEAAPPSERPEGARAPRRRGDGASAEPS